MGSERRLPVAPLSSRFSVKNNDWETKKATYMNRTPARTEALSPRSSISRVAFRHGPLKIAVLLLALALPALAEKPTIEMTPFTSFFVPAADACGFDVLVTAQKGRPNKEKLILFSDKALITGPLFVTVKNLSTGKTIDLNISGPIRLDFSDNLTSVTLHGASLLIGTAEQAAAAGLPQLALIHGRFGFTLGEDGQTTSYQRVSGNVQDVCQLLQ